MKMLNKNKKAISPVIASVLMILVAMVGMTILFALITSYSQAFQTGTGSAVLESITIEDVWFRDTKQIQIWVYNIGKVDLTINSAYLNNELITFAPYPLTLDEGKHGSILITLTESWSSGRSYSLKLVTERGSGFEGTFTP